MKNNMLFNRDFHGHEVQNSFEASTKRDLQPDAVYRYDKVSLNSMPLPSFK